MQITSRASLPTDNELAIHGGMYQGYRTEFRRYIDDKVTIILLTNHEAVLLRPTADSIAEALLGTGK